MFVRVQRIYLLAVLVTVLSGCGKLTITDSLLSVERDLGTGVTEGGRAILGDKRFIFYRYDQGGQCGIGFTMVGGGNGGRGWRSCGNPSLALPATQVLDLPDGTSIVVIYGQLNNPDVAKVTVSLEGGTDITATVGKGMYYVAYSAPGRVKPLVSEVKGFNQVGQEIDQLNSSGRP